MWYRDRFHCPRHSAQRHGGPDPAGSDRVWPRRVPGTPSSQRRAFRATQRTAGSAGQFRLAYVARGYATGPQTIRSMQTSWKTPARTAPASMRLPGPSRDPPPSLQIPVSTGGSILYLRRLSRFHKSPSVSRRQPRSPERGTLLLRPQHQARLTGRRAAKHVPAAPEDPFCETSGRRRSRPFVVSRCIGIFPARRNTCRRDACTTMDAVVHSRRICHEPRRLDPRLPARHEAASPV